MNTYENEVDLPGELDTTLYDDMVEYFGTTPNDVIMAEWDEYGYLYTDLIDDYL